MLVVGGGPAGLAAALGASERGHAVVLVERGKLGGRAQGTDAGGWLLDGGPHLLHRDGALGRLLKRLTGGRPPAHPARPTTWRVVRDGVPQRLMFSPEAHRASGASLGERRAMMRLDRRVAAAAVAAPQRSVASWLPDEPVWVQDVVHALAGLVLHRTPEQVGTLESLAAAWPALRRGRLLLPQEGWGAVIGGLRAAALARGIVIETERQVERLRWGHGGSSVLGAECGGQPVDADLCVLALPRPRVRTLLKDQAEELCPGSRGALHVAVLELGLESEALPGLTGLVDPEASVALSLTSRRVPERLPPVLRDRGVVLVEAIAWLAGSTDDDGIGRIEASLDRHMRGWRQHVVLRRTTPRRRLAPCSRTPAEVVADAAVRRTLAPRGLWLVGADWHDGHGLADSAVASALQVAAELPPP